MNKKGTWAGILVIVMLLLGGCGSRSATGKDLDSIPQRIMALSAVYEAYGVQPHSAYVQDGKVYLIVHKAQKPWETISEEESKNLNQAIHDALDDTFPLRIKSFMLPDKADITGKITALDWHRVLIVNGEHNGSAVWVKLSENVLGGLKIGYQVNVWSNGEITESFPAQTSAIQIQIVKYDTGNADIRGTVTGLNLNETEPSDSYIEVDGKRYQVQPYTLYRINDVPAQLQDIQAGDKAEAWLAGYQLTDKQIISQLMISK